MTNKEEQETNDLNSPEYQLKKIREVVDYPLSRLNPVGETLCEIISDILDGKEIE